MTATACVHAMTATACGPRDDGYTVTARRDATWQSSTSELSLGALDYPSVGERPLGIDAGVLAHVEFIPHVLGALVAE